MARTKHLLKKTRKIDKGLNRKITKNSISRTRSIHNTGNLINNIHLQEGGFLEGLKLKYNMYKFNKILVKFNKLESDMEKEIESIRAQANIFEDSAKEQARVASNYILNYRQKVILRYFKDDIAEIPTDQDIKKAKIDNDIEEAKIKESIVAKRIKQKEKEMAKMIPTYVKLYSNFEAKVKRFNNIIKSYEKFAEFKTTIETRHNQYTRIVEESKDQQKLTSAHKKIVKDYMEHKDQYEKILRFSDQELDRRKKIQNEIFVIFQKANYYKLFFGIFKGEKKKEKIEGSKTPGIIQTELDTAKTNLKEWKKNYNNYVEHLMLINNRVETIKKKIDEVINALEIIIANMYGIFIDKPTERYNSNQIKHALNGMNNISKEFLATSIEYFKKLKEAFYNQTSADRIAIDYTEITFIFNYLYQLLKSYEEFFRGIKLTEDVAAQLGGGVTSNKYQNYLYLNDNNSTSGYLYKHSGGGNGKPGHGKPTKKPGQPGAKKQTQKQKKVIKTLAEIVADPSILETLSVDDIKAFLHANAPALVTNYRDILDKITKIIEDAENDDEEEESPPPVPGMPTVEPLKITNAQLQPTPPVVVPPPPPPAPKPDLQILDKSAEQLEDLENYLASYFVSDDDIRFVKDIQDIISELSKRQINFIEYKDKLESIVSTLQTKMAAGPLDLDTKNAVAGEIGLLIQLSQAICDIYDTAIQNRYDQDDAMRYIKDFEDLYKTTSKIMSAQQTIKDKIIHDSGAKSTAGSPFIPAPVLGGIAGAPVGASTVVISGALGAPGASGTGAAGAPGTPGAAGASGTGADAAGAPASLIAPPAHALEKLILNIPLLYAIQRKEITAQVKRIKDLINFTISKEGLQNIADNVQEMTTSLFKIKYIEPKIAAIEIKPDSTIDLNLDWINKELEKTGDGQHKFSLGNKLKDLYDKNVKTLKFLDVKVSTISNSAIEKKWNIVAFKTPDQFKKYLQLDDTQFAMDLNNIEVMKKFLDIVYKNTIGVDTSADKKESKKKACGFINQLDFIAGLDKDKRELLAKYKNDWDPTGKCGEGKGSGQGGQGGHGGQGGQGQGGKQGKGKHGKGKKGGH